MSIGRKKTLTKTDFKTPFFSRPVWGAPPRPLAEPQKTKKEALVTYPSVSQIRTILPSQAPPHCSLSLAPLSTSFSCQENGRTLFASTRQQESFCCGSCCCCGHCRSFLQIEDSEEEEVLLQGDFPSSLITPLCHGGVFNPWRHLFPQFL